MKLFGDISPKTINVRVLCHKSTSRGGACGGHLLSDALARRRPCEAVRAEGLTGEAGA